MCKMLSGFTFHSRLTCVVKWIVNRVTDLSDDTDKQGSFPAFRDTVKDISWGMTELYQKRVFHLVGRFLYRNSTACSSRVQWLSSFQESALETEQQLADSTFPSTAQGGSCKGQTANPSDYYATVCSVPQHRAIIARPFISRGTSSWASAELGVQGVLHE